MLGRVIRDLLAKPARTTDQNLSARTVADSATYTPEVFAVTDLEHAKAIILTPEGGLTTDQRWETETKYLASAIGEAFGLDNNSLVLDYGCGIGRMSKALIERYDCKVIGVDISTAMRQLAPGYATTDSFSVVSPGILRTLIANGLRVDFGIAIWVLQHCPGVAEDIALIKSALKKNGGLYVLNNNVSAVPTNKGWVNDGVNIRALLEQTFSVLSYSRLPVTATVPMVSENTFIAQFRNDK
jgi:SAM-dependent methyltransferase